MRARAPVLATLGALLAGGVAADEVGKVGVDWAGNDIVIESIRDPKVAGVTCHIAYFERGMIDRLANGNWFEDPSDSAIECQRTGPIVIGDIARGEQGEDVFRASRSIILKTLRVRRIYDEASQTLIYVAHAREITSASAKVAISTLPVAQAD